MKEIASFSRWGMNLNFSKSFTLSGGSSWSIGSNRELQSPGNIVSIRIIGGGVGAMQTDQLDCRVCVGADFEMTIMLFGVSPTTSLY